MKMCLPFVLLICAAPTLFGADPSGGECDGNWWRQQSPTVRLAYVLGLADGITAVQGLEQMRMTESDNAAHRETVSQLLGRAKVGQVVDGLDAIYKDFRNRSIPVNWAFWTVTMSINGLPADAAERQLEDQRRKAGRR